MAKTQPAGTLWRGLAWGDAEPIPRVLLPDASYAEFVATIGYSWNGSIFVRVAPGFATGQAAATAGLVFATIDTAVSGDNTIVAADATRKVKVVTYVMVAATAVSVRWKSGAGTNLSGAMPFGATGGVISPGSPASHVLETAVNQNLVLNLGGAVQVSGHISYFLEA